MLAYPLQSRVQIRRGGGAKKGAVIGSTDDIGLRTIDRPIHVGTRSDHVKVTYFHNGRSERPTIVSGGVVKEALA
jgi:hypothetical protein